MTTTMKKTRWRVVSALGVASLMASLLASLPAIADDGPMVRKDVTKTPDWPSEHAQLSMMQFYVPATQANGELTPIEYYADRDGDNQPDELLETRNYAKPLVVSYYDEVPNPDDPNAVPPVFLAEDVEVGPDFHRDAFLSLSLDDGQTWKEHNVSESAWETSFTLENGTVFPGDVVEVAHSVAGNQILVAWTSKYCAQGAPLYSIKDELDADGDGDTEEPLYEDLFDVAGNQGSIDYAEWMHHGTYPFAEVGEIPFSCVWTARGTVEQVTNPQTGLLQWGIEWRKAERLTSGKRDAYKITVDGVEGAGFAVAWQEDPEGLRPGYGEGPGIGWSGATVNHKTDIWYSSIAAADFAAVDISTQDPETNKPKVATHMSMPLRVTDNYNCLTDRVDSDGLPHPGYCFEDFNGNGIPDLTAETFVWTNAQGKAMNIGVTEDGRLLNGQTGASRPRMELQGYTNADGIKSAWVILTYEETKGLGAGHTDEEPLDIGKDVMYHSFDMFTPDIAAPGTMLNMPETDPLSDSENPTILPLVLNDKLEYQYQTTIGRRPSLIVQPAVRIREAIAAGTTTGMTSAVVLYKDGNERQGGPSDIFMRRLVIPAGFDPTVDNPYDVANLTCNLADTAIVTTSPSAYSPSAYPNGVCLDGAANLSGTTPLTFEPLDNEDPEHGITDRVLTWTQTAEDLGDEQWENKYEVAKGHRGFLDGDVLMVMYAYSPNWLATSHGHEPYNLYIRRSFDGGLTWTTTPADLGGTGTSYDQVNGVGDRVWTETRTLAAGEFEPARNVSQLTSSKETVLDPRYTPTNLGTQDVVTRLLVSVDEFGVPTYGSAPEYYEDDAIRDPSRFFAVYETGDATTILEGGEADPLDLFYSRATAYGDFWDSVDVFAQGRGEYEERWDWLENKAEDMSGEASVGASPGGDFMWAVWNQWQEDESGVISNSDPIFRRLWWDDEVTLIAEAGTYVAAEDELVTLDGAAVYDGDVTDLTYSWDLDMDGVFETVGQTVDVLATGSMQGAALQVCNVAGQCDVDQGWINPGGHQPRVWKAEMTANPQSVGVPVDLTARFTDPGPDDDHTVMVDWGDETAPESAGTLSDDGIGAATIVASHTYAAAGLYQVKVSVTDDDGQTGYDLVRYMVVYDQQAGTVNSNKVTFTDPGGMGTLALEFNARYDATASDPQAPTGKMVLRLGKTTLFEGTTFESLVVSEGTFVAQGVGMFDGEEAKFLVAGVDGKTDLVRVKIWMENGRSATVLYDSQPGAMDTADPTTAILKGGQLVIETN